MAYHHIGGRGIKIRAMVQQKRTLLGEWILAQIAKGLFPSVRQFALSADLSQNALNNIIERGRADPETLVKLAKTAGVRSMDLFHLAGWLTDKEIAEAPSRPLSPQESELLGGFQDLPEEGRLWLLRSLRGMLRYQGEEAQLRAVAEDRSSYPGDSG